MTEPTDTSTAYGTDQDREGTTTGADDDWQASAERNPDDFDADEAGPTEVNPDTGRQYGEID
jgi:hypothetical protein